MRVVHLSVLNPCEHTRIFEKEARSAAQAGHTVYVLAAGCGRPYHNAGIVLLPNGLKGRHWAGRLRVQLLLLRCCLRLRPQLLHLHTPELLPLALLLRWLLACRVIYDRHEDYPSNILHGSHYPAPLRRLLAGAVLLLEHLSIGWVDAVLLAEACYVGQLPHTALLLPNKALPSPPAHRPSTPPIRLLYTGTLAPEWGVDRALELYCQLGPGYTLTLAGHTHSADYARYLQQRCTDVGATLIGGTHYVPHAQLLHLMATHHVGLALYELSPAIAPRVPTKFYEYMAAGLPIVYTDHQPWNALATTTGMGLPASRWGELSAFVQGYQRPDALCWQWDAAPMLHVYSSVGNEYAYV